ncbi:MAG TPA: TonB-dependent receptor plug domain-containing protein, partial [Acidobacteriaceae bacterium]
PKFSTYVVKSLPLHANDALTVNGTLKVGTTDTVVVTADQLQINLENASSQGLISGTQVRELILNNRNYEQLLALQPGVVYGGTSDQLYIGNSLPGGTTNTVSFSVNGQRSSTNNWTIDGADNVDRGSNLTLINFPSVDAISEFKTLRGTYSAAYGRTASAQINVITRSGTNSLHGSLYEFYRNDVFNANNAYSKYSKVARPELRYHDFGGTIGGPVVIPHLYDGRDKTFFFFSEEIRRVISATAIASIEPFPSEIGLDATTPGYNFSSAVCTSVNTTTGACNTGATGTSITPGSVSPTASAYIKDIFSKMPAPNAVGTQDPHYYNYNAKSTFNNEQELVRIDHQLTSKASVFYRFIHDSLPTKEANGLFTNTAGLPGAQTTSTKSPGTTHLGHITYVLSPRSVIDFGYAYTSGSILSVPIGLNAKANSPDINPALPYASSLGIVPVLNFTTSGSTSITGAGVYNDYSKNHNIFGSFTRTWRQHTFTLGASINHYEKTENNTTANAGTFTFNGATNKPSTATTIQQGIANFLLGAANGGFTQPNIAAVPDMTELQEEGFIQDDWKVSRRLTVNIGVRYSHFLQPVDNNGLLSSFLPNSYVAANAPTIDTTGNLCTSAEVAAITPTTAFCPGSTTLKPNASNDLLNGIILGNYTAANQHYSPYGSQVSHTDKFNFAPRAGLAWDVFGNGRTSLRMGYGMAYDASLLGMFEQNIFANPPYVTTSTYASTTLDSPAGANTSQYVPPTLQATPANYHSPYSQQYSLDIQQQLAHDVMLDIGYFGSHDTHLLGREDINEPRPGAAITAGLANATTGYTSSANSMVLNQIRPFKGYGPINSVQSIFNSNYNSLQVQVQKRFGHGSLINANYTWSRAMTNAQADRSGAVQNIYDLSKEWGRSQYDRRHVFAADVVYHLPWFYEQKGLVGHVLGGWEFSGIAAVNSGLPFTATTSSWDPAGLGFSGTSIVSGRPDQIADPNSTPSGGAPQHTFLHFFNTAAFVRAPACTAAATCRPGNAKQDVVDGPGFFRVDAGLIRNFKVGSYLNFQFRGEAFNVFNKDNFASIGTAINTASSYGMVTATRDPRILQVALKASF